MGTYTTNYNLFLPSIGEQGWGELVNGNFATIDSTMKSLSNRITAIENEVNGNLSCTSVATSGTITSTGLITGNGGFKGNLTGNVTGDVTGRILLNSKIATSGDILYSTCAAQSYSHTVPANNTDRGYQSSLTCFTVTGYVNQSISYPYKISHGIYVKAPSSGSVPSSVARTLTFTVTLNNRQSDSAYLTVNLMINGADIAEGSGTNVGTILTHTCTVYNGDVIGLSYYHGRYVKDFTISATVSKGTDYYVQAI